MIKTELFNDFIDKEGLTISDAQGVIEYEITQGINYIEVL